MKLINILMVLLFTFLLSPGLIVTASASVVNSAHDLSTRPGTVETDKICAFCHIPHHAKNDTVLDYNPLWSAGVQTSTSFIPYTSATLDADMTGDPLVGPSRLCIGCHDGTIAVDIALKADSNRMIAPPVRIGVGATLASDHPIGFDYIAAAAADVEIQPATTGFAAGTIADYLFNSGAEQIMTCATCHDVHEQGGPHEQFLYVNNTGSALCLSCHIK